MFRVSCIQLKSNNNIHFNLKKTETLIIKELKKDEGVITATINEKIPMKLRSIIPSLKND